ncbi:MAG: hypothetical protein DRI57_17615 [Deltaproteobacteria bacterium]|nr:MAG: hypothetical protein DRI57_17615 [Deltaproteobacteria bacterium]
MKSIYKKSLVPKPRLGNTPVRRAARFRPYTNIAGKPGRRSQTEFGNERCLLFFLENWLYHAKKMHKRR